MKKEMPILTFDMDNTLIHSDKAHIIAFNKALEKMGFKKKKHWDIEKHFGKPKMEVIRAITPVQDKKIHQKIARLHDHYLYTQTKKYSKRIKGVLTALKKLKKHYVLAVLSNCGHHHIEILLKASNIDPKMFDLLIGGDEVLHSKPHPDEIFKVRHLLHHKPLYHIGDSIYDIRAAKRADVKSIGVLTGFFTRHELEKESPTFILNSVAELPKLLLKK